MTERLLHRRQLLRGLFDKSGNWVGILITRWLPSRTQVHQVAALARWWPIGAAGAAKQTNLAAVASGLEGDELSITDKSHMRHTI